MQKFYLLQSKHDTEEPGDVLININTIKAFHFNKIKDDLFSLKLDCGDSTFFANFTMKEQAIVELKSILHELGCDESLADKIRINDKKKEFEEKDLRRKLMFKLLD